VDTQEKEGSHCSFGDSLIVCQPLCSVQANSAECVTVQQSEQCIVDEEQEPMRISLDFAKTDSDEEMSVVQDEQPDVNFDSVQNNDSEHAATSS